MFKKLLIASAVLVMGSSVSFAGKHHYKGEDYKGERMVCPTYQFTAGPYLGLSVGPRTNYTGTPTVYKAIEGTLSAGWAGMLDPMWYLAAEIFVGDSAQIEDYKNSGNGVKSTWSYGLDIIPGFMITDHVLAYLRAGVIETRFQDQGQNKTGWQVGLGGQTNVYQNWDIRGEYVYSGYGKVSGIGKVSADQFNFGVVYKWA